jgi:hypothetical protein
MEIGMGIWRVAKEWSGVGVQQRLVMVILGGRRPQAAWKVRTYEQFLESAGTAVSKFGPGWAKRKIGRRSVGVWLLLFCGFVSPAMVALAAIFPWGVFK